MKKATIFGFHGMKNLGDDYFLNLLIQMCVEQKYSKLYISGIQENLPIKKNIQIIGILRKKMKLRWIEKWFRIFIYSLRSDVLIFSAGSILTILEFKTAKLVIKTLKLFNPKIKVLALGVSIGPFKTLKDQENALNLLREFKYIMVRDNKSLTYLEKDFPVPVVQSKDLAFTFLRKPISVPNKYNNNSITLGIALNEYKILFNKENLQEENIRNDKIIMIIKKLSIQYKIEKIYIFETSSHLQYGDQRVSQYINDNLKNEMNTEYIQYNHNKNNDFIKTLGLCNLLIASRLHAGFFSLAQNVSVLQLAYAEKIHAFYENLTINHLKIHDAYAFNEEKVQEDIVYMLKHPENNNAQKILYKESLKLQSELEYFKKENLR